MYISIIILNYNNSYDTINCIKSVLNYNTYPVKFIVVDNGSSNLNVIEELDFFLKETFQNDYAKFDEFSPQHSLILKKATFLVSKSNDGYAVGNNKGLKLAYADSSIDKVLILNNDILFIEDFLPELTERLKTLPNAAIVSPLLLKKDKKEIDYTCARKSVGITEMIYQNICYTFRKSTNVDLNRCFLYKEPKLLKKQSLQIDLPSGSCMLFSKKMFEKIGSFDPGTFLYYEEDILCQKIKKEGMVNYICPQLRCVHLGAASTKKVKFSYSSFMKSRESQRYYVHNFMKPNFIGLMIYELTRIIFNFSVWLPLKLKNKI
ncbi:glycosyltransferase [Marseilla massiliensis]|uniref:Glycosyltransferase n=1 Tax=Marseilla massiliensis TaxID=1841864 RepID=A0A939B5X9_9BACT|nr:glycosyltransferase [Marseilla massiliensis]MBM6663070.1 glycosyltransferase [Marseilla massiliensis]